MAKFDERFFNPDGSIKRLLQVVEVLPDGTRVFEDGSKASPSMVDMGGENVTVRLDSLSAQERADWESNLMKRVGKEMSLFYRAQAI